MESKLRGGEVVLLSLTLLGLNRLLTGEFAIEQCSSPKFEQIIQLLDFRLLNQRHSKFGVARCLSNPIKY
jgi:hypothetical protein